MIYLMSISAMLYLLWVATAFGRRLTDLLPKSLRESAAFYVAPLLGLASLVLIAKVYGWLSPFKPRLSIAISLGLLFFGIVFEKKKFALFRDLAILSVFIIIVTLPILAPAIRFDAFNPFNDTFTYLVHGQWLQAHAFSEAARGSGFFPAETQVALYQWGAHRMGSSFFLGFVQSLFRLEWSYFAYLPTVSLVFALGSLTLGGIIRQVLPVSKISCLALCALPAFMMNGFAFGAQYGFFPQTFGLAFSTGIACLIPGLAADVLCSKPGWIRQFFNFLPLALCGSAFLICYGDMFTMMAAAVLLFFLWVCVLHWSEKTRLLGTALVLTAQVSVLVNSEGIRLFKNLMGSMSNVATGAARFGWPMYWSPLEFMAHSFGMKSSFQSDLFFVDRIISTWIFPVVLIVMILVLAKILRAKQGSLAILFLVCVNIILWSAFLKFRYATPSLGKEVGFTFIQYKISKWAVPFNLALLGVVIAWVLSNAGRYKRACQCIFAIAAVAGMAFQYLIVAPIHTKQFQDETTLVRSSFNMLLELRSRVASIPKDQVIYLGFGGEHHKLRQMVAYILSDRKLASKYDDDGYIAGTIPLAERNMPIETADWMIQWKLVPTADENPLDRVGPFFIRRAPFSFFQLESITGAYDTESGDKKSWNWIKDDVEYRFHGVGKTQGAKVRFEFLVSGQPRTLFLELDTAAGKRMASYTIPMPGGWGRYESPVINTDAQDLIVRFRADGEPARLSAGDPRVTKYLIQNLSLDGSL